MQAVRSVTGKDVPVFAWHAGNACFYLRIFGPERYGGLGEVPEKAHGEVTDEVIASFSFPSKFALFLNRW